MRTKPIVTIAAAVVAITGSVTAAAVSKPPLSSIPTECLHGGQCGTPRPTLPTPVQKPPLSELPEAHADLPQQNTKPAHRPIPVEQRDDSIPHRCY